MSLLSSAILKCCENVLEGVPLGTDMNMKTYAGFVQKQVSHASEPLSAPVID